MRERRSWSFAVRRQASHLHSTHLSSFNNHCALQTNELGDPPKTPPKTLRRPSKVRSKDLPKTPSKTLGIQYTLMYKNIYSFWKVFGRSVEGLGGGFGRSLEGLWRVFCTPPKRPSKKSQRQTDRRTERQTKTDRQTDRQTDRPTDRETDSQTD